jgi:hypothetical protein
MCTLNSTIEHCGNVVPGVSNLYIARRAEANTFLYPNVARTGLSLVNDITNNGAPVPWYEFYCEFNTNFQETLSRSDAGGNFPQQLTCVFPQLSTDSRIALEQLINDRVCIIAKTLGSEFWLLGQEFGLKVEEYTASPGPRSGVNAYTVTFVSQGREQFRRVSTNAFVANIAVNGGMNARQAIVKDVGGSGSGGTITDVLSTWTMPLFQLGNQPIIDVIK